MSARTHSNTKQEKKKPKTKSKTKTMKAKARVRVCMHTQRNGDTRETGALRRRVYLQQPQRGASDLCVFNPTPRGVLRLDSPATNMRNVPAQTVLGAAGAQTMMTLA